MGLPAKQGAASTASVWPGAAGSAPHSARLAKCQEGEIAPGERAWSQASLAGSLSNAVPGRCSRATGRACGSGWDIAEPRAGPPVLHQGHVLGWEFWGQLLCSARRRCPGLPFFITFCVLAAIPQWSALSRREEGSPAWASRFGLKGSDDKNAWNESFGRGGSYLVSIRQKSRRNPVFLPPSSSSSSLQTLHDTFPCTLQVSERRLCVCRHFLHAHAAPRSGLGRCYGPCLPCLLRSLCYSQGRPVSYARPGRCLHQHRGRMPTDQNMSPSGQNIPLSPRQVPYGCCRMETLSVSLGGSPSVSSAISFPR